MKNQGLGVTNFQVLDELTDSDKKIKHVEEIFELIVEDDGDNSEDIIFLILDKIWNMS